MAGYKFLTYPSYSTVYKSRDVFFSSLVPGPEAMAFLGMINIVPDENVPIGNIASYVSVLFVVRSELRGQTTSFSLPFIFHYPFHIRKRK